MTDTQVCGYKIGLATTGERFAVSDDLFAMASVFSSGDDAMAKCW